MILVDDVRMGRVEIGERERSRGDALAELSPGLSSTQHCLGGLGDITAAVFPFCLLVEGPERSSGGDGAIWREERGVGALVVAFTGKSRSTGRRARSPWSSSATILS